MFYTFCPQTLKEDCVKNHMNHYTNTDHKQFFHSFFHSVCYVYILSKNSGFCIFHSTKLSVAGRYVCACFSAKKIYMLSVFNIFSFHLSVLCHCVPNIQSVTATKGHYPTNTQLWWIGSIQLNSYFL